MFKEITNWDWPKTRQVRDGYDWTDEPELAIENFEFLADKYNEIAEFLNKQFNLKEADNGL